jgi:hypothetical protein
VRFLEFESDLREVLRKRDSGNARSVTFPK